MKKIFVLTFFLMLLFHDINADIIIGPSKNKEVGAVVGRIYMYIDKKWGDLDPGNYYTVDVFIENIVTKKQYRGIRLNEEDGYFYIINIPPGQYILKRLDFTYYKYDMKYFFQDFKVYRSDNGKSIEGINFGVHDKTITTIKTIFIYAKMMPDEKVWTFYTREGDTEHLINFFKKIDYHKKWSHFEFGDFEVE